jgi:hypothetical protein
VVRPGTALVLLNTNTKADSQHMFSANP